MKSAYLICALLSVLLFASGCFTGDSQADQADATHVKAVGTCLTDEDAECLADRVLQLVNLERATADLPPVAWNVRLVQIAADHACQMIERGYFGHRDPLTGRGPADRAVAGRYAFYSVGENLAAGQESAADVINVWMESPSHREIILDPSWKEVGVAVRSGGEYQRYWVIEFGDPADLLAQAGR